jgi:hypothetical protein
MVEVWIPMLDGRWLCRALRSRRKKFRLSWITCLGAKWPDAFVACLCAAERQAAETDRLPHGRKLQQLFRDDPLGWGGCEFRQRGQARPHRSEFLFAELLGTAFHHPLPLRVERPADRPVRNARRNIAQCPQ